MDREDWEVAGAIIAILVLICMLTIVAIFWLGQVRP